MTPETLTAWRTSIDGHEGNVLRVYDDATGKIIVPNTLVRGWPSIGRGRNLADPGISQSESDSLLSNDMARVQSQLDVLLPWWRGLSEARQLVMGELGFNLGVAKLVHAWPNTVKAIQENRFQEAADMMRGNQVWMAQVHSRGEQLARLMETGILV